MSVREATRKSLSPTAQLLRSSRLFSLPKPLPRPDVSQEMGSGILMASHTATLPYPTHQAIATTPSSLARGDWGLKRPLPLKSTTTTSTPTVRIGAIDSLEHITDFESAADHALNLKKWQEMNVAMMTSATPSQDLSSVERRSAFERNTDITDPEDKLVQDELAKMARLRAGRVVEALSSEPTEPESQKSIDYKYQVPEGYGQKTTRWRVRGPWLPGITPGEFDTYISALSTRKREFNAYTRAYIQKKIIAARTQRARDAGEDLPSTPSETAKFEHVAEADYKTNINILRKDCFKDPLNAELTTQIIIPFLDLPAMPTKGSDHLSSNMKVGNRIKEGSEPKSTHPSAGLSYLRSSSYLPNHPLLGPQRSKTPIPARVLQTRKGVFNNEKYAKLGVGGFVVLDTEMGGAKAASVNADGVGLFDPDAAGGKKVWVNPTLASVRPDGRVRLEVGRADWESVRVKEGEVEDKPPTRVAVEGAGKRGGLWGGLQESSSIDRAGNAKAKVEGFEVEDGADPLAFLRRQAESARKES